MDLLDDFLSEPSTVKAPAANRFKPKVKPRTQKGPSVANKATKEQPNDFADKKLDAPKSSSCTNNETVGTKETSISEPTISENQLIDGNFAVAEEVEGSAKEDGHLSADTSSGLQYPESIAAQSMNAPNLPVEMATLDASDAQNAEEMPGFEISFASPSPFRECTQNPHDLSTPSTYQDSGDVWIEIEEGAVGFSCLEDGDMMSEAATASGKRPVKFQPKPKPQSGRDKDAPNLAYENQNMNGDGSMYTGEPHTMSSFPSADLDGNFIVNPTTSQPGHTVYQDPDSWMAQNLPEQCGELGKSMADDGLNTDKSHDGATGSEPNEDGYEINDGMNNEVHDHNSDQLTTSRGESNLGSETSKKKRPRKSKKVASENDESGGKKSKIAKVPDQSANKPAMKVPRAPRRKRCVNKALLEAPEDEIDLLRVPIRDLIILADYKERQAKKNAEAVQPSLANEGTDNAFQEDPPYDGDEGYDEYGNTLDYDDNGESYDNPSTSATINIKDTGYYNYHSFMDKSKTTKVRWSKDDTELFYQGIREFGSDFLMIQKMHFPTRTRNQIKLKYKKEERENPAILHDALNSRAKDLSHFQVLAQRVKKEAVEREGEENDMYGEGDDWTGPTGEEEDLHEGTLKTHATSQEEVAKTEEKSATIADQEPETTQDGSPTKSHDIYNEDEFNWDDYKSEL